MSKKKKKRSSTVSAASKSRYDSEKYNRTGSRYDSESYNRTGSRYDSEDYNRSGSRYTEEVKSSQRVKAQKIKAQKAKTQKVKTDRKTEADRKQDNIKSTQAKISHTEKLTEQLAGLSGSVSEVTGSVSESVAASVKQMGLKKGVAAAAGILAVVLYGAGAYYYSHHYYPGTTVMGTDCSHMTPDEVRGVIEEIVDGYRLSIRERGGETSLVYASQIDLVYEDDQSLEQTLEDQQAGLWLFNRGNGSETQIAVHTDYSDELAQELMDDLPFMDTDNMTAPVDAHLEIVDQYLEVIPEEMGTTLDIEKTRNTIIQAMDEGKSSLSLEESGCYIDPQIYADDEALNTEMHARNELLGADFTLELGSRSRQIGAQAIMDLMSQNEDGSYYISDGSVWDYVAQLAEEFDTYGKEHVFRTTFGTTEYLYDGDYGWQLEQDETAQTILNAIRDRYQGTVDPIYLHTAKSREENDIGDTYVEICIAEQEMWLYVDGEMIVDTPVVTGNPSQNNETPSGGVWAIDGKYTNFTLVGEGYRTPVEYWMPFNGGVGIHDLQSRGYFGGTIYLTNGSHGCINTPIDAVKTIYEYVEVGTPVIVYDGE